MSWAKNTPQGETKIPDPEPRSGLHRWHPFSCPEEVSGGWSFPCFCALPALQFHTHCPLHQHRDCTQEHPRTAGVLGPLREGQHVARGCISSVFPDDESATPPVTFFNSCLIVSPSCLYETSGSSSPHTRTCSRPFRKLGQSPRGGEGVAAGSRLHSWARPHWQELWTLDLTFLRPALTLTFLSAWDQVQLFSRHSKPALPPSSGRKLILPCPS